MKQLVRRYGMDVLEQLTKIRHLAWVIPAEARHNQVFLEVSTLTKFYFKCLELKLNVIFYQ